MDIECNNSITLNDDKSKFYQLLFLIPVDTIEPYVNILNT